MTIEMISVLEALNYIKQTIRDIPGIVEASGEIKQAISYSVSYLWENDIGKIRGFTTFLCGAFIIYTVLVIFTRRRLKHLAKGYSCRYVYHYWNKSIAVNIETRQIFLLSGIGIYLYSLSDFRDVQFSNDNHFISWKKGFLRNDSPNFGLKIKTGDIDNPEWNIIFDAPADKERWKEIFQKMREA